MASDSRNARQLMWTVGLLALAVVLAFLALAPIALIGEFAGVLAGFERYVARGVVLALAIALAVAAFTRRDTKELGRRVAFYSRQRLVPLGVLVLVLIWVFVYLIPDILIFVKPGEVGVLWKRFQGGTVTTRVYEEGTHVIFPWDKMYIYDIRLQHRNTSFEVLSRDGLQYTVNVTVRFRLIKEDVGLLHKHVGPNYVETLIFPEVGSHSRAVISQYRTDEVYTEARLRIESEVEHLVRNELTVSYMPEQPRESFIHIENILFREILLPPKVKMAIEDKLAQEQQMLEYDYRLAKEAKEAERKRIEAQGIQDFQTTVQRGITDSYLKWKGIEATLELARSPNSKIVVIGAGDDGLPLILGGFDSPSSPIPLPELPGDMSALPPRAPTSAEDDTGPARIRLPDRVGANPASELPGAQNPANRGSTENTEQGEGSEYRMPESELHRPNAERQ